MDILFNLDVDYISDYSNMRNLRLSILNVLLNNPKKAEKENEWLSNTIFKVFPQEALLDFGGENDTTKIKHALLLPPPPHKDYKSRWRTRPMHYT